jgi:hypothetical protein
MSVSGMTYLAETDPDLALAPLQSAACTDRIALGPPGGPKSTEPANRLPPRGAAHATTRCQRAGL